MKKFIFFISIIFAIGVHAQPVPTPTLFQFSRQDNLSDAGYKITVKFLKTDFFEIEYEVKDDFRLPGAPYKFGTSVYKDPTGKTQNIPNYVIAIIENLRILRRHWDLYGGILDEVDENDPMTITVRYREAPFCEKRGANGEFEGGEPARVVWSKLYDEPYMTIDAGLEPGYLIGTLAHEYYHAVQFSIYASFRIAPPGTTDIRKVVIESTAEVASDLNIATNTTHLPVGHKVPKVLDDLNPHQKRVFPWFKNLTRDMETLKKDEEFEYESAVFFKYLIEYLSNDTPGKDVRSLKKFMDFYHSYWRGGKVGFVRAVKDSLGGEKKLEKFLYEFVSAHIVQVGGGVTSFRDDSIAQDGKFPRTSMINLEETTNKRVKVSLRCHYVDEKLASNCDKFPTLEKTVAANSIEIRQRMGKIALPFKMNALALNFQAIEKPKGRTVKVGNSVSYVNYQEKKSNLFTYLEIPKEGRSKYQYVLYTQDSGSRTSRQGSEGLQRHEDFVGVKVNGKVTAFKKFLGQFCNRDENSECANDTFNRVWVGGMNFDESGSNPDFQFAYVVTPTVQTGSEMGTDAPKGPFDTETIWLTKSVPERKAGDKFKKGDKVTLKLNFSDQIHSANKTTLNHDEVSAEITLKKVSDDSELELDKTKIKWRLIDKDRMTYEVDFEIPKVKKKGEYKVEVLVRSLLKLGEDDKNIDDSLVLNLKGKVGLDDRSDH